ncbi:MAG: Cro/CI family transcriptional regulator [Aquabacterium sp.]|nr:Cro/CI family transcriptional regulator [Aquabacterium sp.]
MKLNTWTSSERGRSLWLANAVGVSPPVVSDWCTGKKAVPLERCVAIERATNGEVTRQDLRPDDWQDIWPELAQAPATIAPVATESVAPAAAAEGEASVLREGVVRRHANRRAADTPVSIDRRAPIGKVFYSIDKGEA